MICPAFVHITSTLPSEVLVPFLLSRIKIQRLDAFDGIATTISFTSTAAKPLHSIATAAFFWTLRQCTVSFGTSIHTALLVRYAPEPSKCRSKHSEPSESPTVAKVSPISIADRIPCCLGAGSVQARRCRMWHVCLHQLTTTLLHMSSSGPRFGMVVH